MPAAIRTQARSSVARAADRLGMWWMLRSDYGSDYPIEPHQITQSDVSPYAELAFPRDRAKLFPSPGPATGVSLHGVDALLDHPERRPLWMPAGLDLEESGTDLERRDFSFDSPHVPLSRDFERQYATTPENHRVHGRLYAPRGTPARRCVLVVHGFAASSLDSVARFTPAARMAARGAAVAVVALPYHGPRKPAQARFSGELFMSGDVVRTFEGILQAVSDLRATLRWLREEQGFVDVGLIGGSLGGYLATLTAAVDASPAFLYALAPAIRVTDRMEAVPLGRYMVEGLARQPVLADVIARLQDIVDPSLHDPALPTSRMRFFAGRNDLFVPTNHMERLVERWTGIDVHWHDWGHLTALLAWPPRRLFDEVERFMDELSL